MIARKLAAANYKKYPPIVAEINHSSDHVDEATRILASAIHTLQCTLPLI